MVIHQGVHQGEGGGGGVWTLLLGVGILDITQDKATIFGRHSLSASFCLSLPLFLTHLLPCMFQTFCVSVYVCVSLSLFFSVTVSVSLHLYVYMLLVCVCLCREEVTSSPARCPAGLPYIKR